MIAAGRAATGFCIQSVSDVIHLARDDDVLPDETTFWTSGRATPVPMVSVWLVTTGFVIATFVTTKVRGYRKMPRALRDAIAADAIFGALLLMRALL
jgi:hypothetical protein